MAASRNTPMATVAKRAILRVSDFRSAGGMPGELSKTTLIYHPVT
jgi:hypothetical protein